MSEEEKDTTIVSLDKYSLKDLQEQKFYACPKWGRKIMKYFAFYEGKPISAVTSYAEVDSVQEGGREIIPPKYWLMNLARSNPPYIMIKFKNFKELKTPVKAEGYGRSVQGRIYTNLEKLKKAKKISDLF